MPMMTNKVILTHSILEEGDEITIYHFDKDGNYKTSVCIYTNGTFVPKIDNNNEQEKIS